MDNNNSGFKYSYSAKEQAEVKAIREKYVAKEEKEDMLSQLRRLDRSVTKKGMVISLILGIIGSIVMGVGMCCCMVWAGAWFIPGIFIGIAGIAAVALAYPVYNALVRAEKARIAPEILRLTDELMR